MAWTPPAPTSVLLVAALLGGCGSPDPSPPSAAYEERDSAGIRIVASRQPMWSEGDEWRVEPTPMLRLGALDGPDAEQFADIGGAARLSDGRVVVSDAQSGTLRFFGSDGRHLRTVGRLGDGPEEFNGYMSFFVLPNDTILVLDRVNDRVWISPEGQFLRRNSMARDALNHLVDLEASRDGMYALWMADGSMLGASTRHPPFPWKVGDWIRPVTTVHLVTLEGSQAEPVYEFGGSQSQVIDRGGGPDPVGFFPFAVIGQSTSAASGQAYVAADGAKAEVFRFSPTRGPEILRWNQTPTPVTEAAVAAWTEATTDGLDGPSQTRVAQTLAAVETPAVMPVVDEVMAARDGSVWVRGPLEDPTVHGETGVRWRVLGASGHLLGVVELPSGLTPTDIGEDYLVGVRLDGLDVPIVQVHRLVR